MSEQEPNLASREEVIEASRRRYGMPRAEVEELVAKQLGYPSPAVQNAELKERLLHQLQGLGVTERQAMYLLNSYPLERIERQVAWLPFRHPHTPSALLITAIRRNYDPPDGLYVSGADKGAPPCPDDNLPSPRQ